MWRTIPRHFAADHPTAAGHFPSNPIIPGALLIDAVLEALGEYARVDGEVTVLAAKFFRPVRAGREAPHPVAIPCRQQSQVRMPARRK